MSAWGIYLLISLRHILVVLACAAPLFGEPMRSENVVLLDAAPASTRDGALESNTDAFMWRERSFVSDSAYRADRDGFGPGTRVDSWYVHFDPVGSDQIINPDGMFISFTFEHEILGLDLRADTLTLGDEFFGSAGTEYRAGEEFRGTELDNVDIIRITDDRRTVRFDFKVWYENADEFRIFTAAPMNLGPPSPEPGTLVLFTGAAIAGMAILRRQRWRCF
ncbi:MAG: PEP-CTERM sorting domain-containing protein [Planctomycetota bacterium]